MHNGGGEFVIGKGIATTLHEAVERLGIKTRFKKNLLLLTYAQLEELARRGFAVRFLNDAEKNAIREVKPAVSAVDVEAIRRILEEIAKIARIVAATDRGLLYIRIVPYEESRLEEIATKLRAVGIRATVLTKKKEVRIYERKSIETIRKVAPHFFHPLYIPLHKTLTPNYYQTIFAQPFTKN